MSEFRESLRAELATLGDPDRAVKQQAYMKSALPFHGVPVPQVRSLTRSLVRRLPVASRAEFVHTVEAVWDGATHREERYAALALLRAPRYKQWARDVEIVPLLRRLIVDAAWWDLVDELSHCVGDVLRSAHEAMEPVVREWSRDDNLWLRRSSIICQLGFREATDLSLLTEAIDGSIGDRDFFARKAIGWALREYAKTDSEWVRGYVAANEARLSPLSRREALKSR
ncbi:hypothetical protein BW730_15645 [Tessaracoccus aquimaris]|uniref:DNA alkylation repair protein n=1 Tax=Tessaracoccus aquimaris TaxID=1332264 RepID=A0A1Q2CRH5_9ACTN|nr:DNA alkylation repair protein [Tessaracoccus aquimaris]AQP48723.1 hypothetical protein BW730_15645 [Tessaracoccus aquimaris]